MIDVFGGINDGVVWYVRVPARFGGKGRLWKVRVDSYPGITPKFKAEFLMSGSSREWMDKHVGPELLKGGALQDQRMAWELVKCVLRERGKL